MESNINNEVDQYQRYLQDLIDYPLNQYNGIYRNISWSIKRIYGHWDGYIHGLSDNQIDIIEPYVHGGITAKQYRTIGFNCAHSSSLKDNSLNREKGDYYHGWLRQQGYNSILYQPNNTYKNYNWIVNHLYSLIDLISTN